MALRAVGTVEFLSSSGELLSLHPSRMLVGIKWDLLDAIKTAGSSFLSCGVRKSTLAKLTLPEALAFLQGFCGRDDSPLVKFLNSERPCV